MKTIKGNNLIIKADGVIVAASKSCSVEVGTDTIKVSSNVDGNWDYSRAGRKSWSVNTNHLLVTPQGADGLIKMKSVAHDYISTNAASWMDLNGYRTNITGRGLTVFVVNYIDGVYMVLARQTFDTYGNSETEGNAACQDMIDFIDNYNTYMMAIISYDAFRMTSDLAASIEGATGVDLSNVFIGEQRSAICIAGNASAGIEMYAEQVNDAGGEAHAELWLAQGAPATATPVKDVVSRIGVTYELSFQLDGYAYDHLSGKAICRQWRGTFTRGNLAQGSFVFEGSGPLE